MKFINWPNIQLWHNKPRLRSPDAYIPAINTARYLEGKNKLLIVGDAGGRDWMHLRQLDKEIYLVDIAHQENIPNLYDQSIEKPTPFDDKFFDGVVMNEVVEHLFFDVDALNEINRILKDDGILVVTVPYMSNVQDIPEFHVRVHSPKSIRRLLERCGFEIEEHFCRGFCSRLPQWGVIPRSTIYLIHKLFEKLLRISPQESVEYLNGSLERFERFLGSNPMTIRFQKLFASYGGIMKAKKRVGKRDFDEIQKSRFSNTPLK